jgi:hypothetical protein
LFVPVRALLAGQNEQARRGEQGFDVAGVLQRRGRAPRAFRGGDKLMRRMASFGKGTAAEGDSENLATSDGSVAPAAAARRARNPTERPARAPRRGAEGHRVARGGGTARAEDAAVADADAISTPRTDRARERV